MWTTTGLVLLTLTHNIQFGLHIVKHKDYWQHFPEIFCLSLYEHQRIPFVQIFSLAVLWLAMTHCSVCDLPSWMSCPPAAAACSSSILTFQHSSAAQHTVAITNATGTVVWQFRHFTPDLYNLYIELKATSIFGSCANEEGITSSLSKFKWIQFWLFSY